MGNCVQSSGGIEAGRRQPQRRRSAAGEEEEEEEVIIDHQGALAPSVMKVKMVLTKGELGWLVAQLKAGDRRLEDVLQEMARKREGRAVDGDGWRPSLESIVECPAAETEAASSDD